MESKHKREKVATQIGVTKEKAYLKRHVEELRLDRCRSRRMTEVKVGGRLKDAFCGSL